MSNKGKTLHSSLGKIIYNVIQFCQSEKAIKSPMIDINKVTERVAAMTATDSQPDTTVAATDEPLDELARQTGICRQCICNETKVDCFDQKVATFFKKEEWAALTKLKPTEVDLSENLFSSVTAIAELPIKLLNLSRCNIESIENASFKDLQEMETLDLSYNQLTSAKLSPHAFEGRYSPEEYEPLSAMRTLSLAHNQLHSLHQDLFEHLPELTSLDLSGNPLATIDHVTLVAISSLPMLKVLRMRSCQLPAIPEKFLHTPLYLESLDLSDNLLQAVPQELAETRSLRYLNLNQNPVRKLDVNSEEYPGFPLLRKLEELHMCHMPLLRAVGAGALARLPALRRLHLAHNPALAGLHARAMARPDDAGEGYDWPLLTELYLSSNNLTEIDSRLISRWDLLQRVDVSDNPYLCDCAAQWMVDVLVPIVEGKGVNASSMVCQEPVEMRGYTFSRLHAEHRRMRCLDKYGHRPERDGSILLGALIGVLLAVPIVLSVMMAWRRGYLACVGLTPPTEHSRAFYKRAPAEDNYI